MESKRVRRNFSAQEKVKILREHLIEKNPVSEICEKYNLSVNVFYSWQKTFFENGSAAFENENKKVLAAKDKRIEELERKLADRDEGIAELMMEHVKLKKKLCLN